MPNKAARLDCRLPFLAQLAPLPWGMTNAEPSWQGPLVLLL